MLFIKSFHISNFGIVYPAFVSYVYIPDPKNKTMIANSCMNNSRNCDLFCVGSYIMVKKTSRGFGHASCLLLFPAWSPPLKRTLGTADFKYS